MQAYLTFGFGSVQSLLQNIMENHTALIVILEKFRVEKHQHRIGMNAITAIIQFFLVENSGAEVFWCKIDLAQELSWRKDNMAQILDVITKFDLLTKSTLITS
jgi:hypothetical protein